MFKNMVYKNTIKFMFSAAALVLVGVLGYGKGIMDPFILTPGTIPFWWCAAIGVFIALVWFNTFLTGLRFDRNMIDAKNARKHLENDEVDAVDRVLIAIKGDIPEVRKDSLTARLFVRIGKSLKTNARYNINVDNFQMRYNNELGRPLMWVTGNASLLTVLGLIGTFAGFMFGIDALGLSGSIVFEEIVAKIGMALDGFKTAFATTLYGAVGYVFAAHLVVGLKSSASEISNMVVTMTDTQVLPVVNDEYLSEQLMERWWEESETQQEA